MSDEKTSNKAHLNIQHDGSIVHVTFPRGRIDGTAVTKLYDTAPQLIPGPDTKLLVDLTGVHAINSGGVGMMITLKHRAMTAKAQFHLAIPEPGVREVFDVMKLEKILDMFPTPEEAKAAFKS